MENFTGVVEEDRIQGVRIFRNLKTGRSPGVYKMNYGIPEVGRKKNWKISRGW